MKRRILLIPAESLSGGAKLRPQPREKLNILLQGKCITQTLTGFTSRRECCIPLLPYGVNALPKKKCCLPPSCGFPPKSFPLKREPTISGDTFGARAQATALRHLCGAANYATCNAPASRRDGALPAYGTSCPTRLTRCARNNRWTFGSALCPCSMCKSGVPAKNLQGFFVGYFLAGRLQPRISSHRV